MKTKIIVPLGIVIIGTFLLTGCLGGEGTELTPEEALMNSFEKSEAIETYEMSGNLNMDMEAQGESMQSQGTVKMYSEGNKTRSDVTITMQGQTIKSSSFNTPEGAFSCQEQAGEWMCTQEEMGMMESFGVMDLEEIQRLKNEEALSFPQDTVEVREVAGRTCNYVEMELDPSEIEDEAELMEGEMKINQCLDQETGIPIQSIADMDISMMGQSLQIDTTMEIDSLETGLDLPEDVFELPAEPIDQQPY